ncbi:MAG TPA: hypothetical protein VI756_29895, partial [Blastocatellia bacterium]
MLADVPTRRIDVFLEDGCYVLQTTKHPKLDVTKFVNAFPKSALPKDPDAKEAGPAPLDRMHSRIQWALIRLGRAEGCSIWVPPNDRCLTFNREPFASDTVERLPKFGFDENTRRIVQNIDVLWLSHNVISKAFEVESTTSIYSGLLRLNDLVLAQPNNQISLYIVAAQSKRDRVRNQLLRPSFRQLVTRCRFIDFESIETQADRLEALQTHERVRV